MTQGHPNCLVAPGALEGGDLPTRGSCWGTEGGFGKYEEAGEDMDGKASMAEGWERDAFCVRQRSGEEETAER